MYNALDRENGTEESEKGGKRKRKLAREKKEDCITAKRTGCTVTSPVGYAKFVSVRGEGAAGTTPSPPSPPQKIYIVYHDASSKKRAKKNHSPVPLNIFASASLSPFSIRSSPNLLAQMSRCYDRADRMQILYIL